MTEHTPTPWKIVRSRDVSGDVGITADGLPNVLAECFADIRWGAEHNTSEASANAAFIVKAVNAHDLLVSALTMSRSVHQEIADNYEPTTTEHGLAATAIATIDAALAKAGA